MSTHSGRCYCILHMLVSISLTKDRVHLLRATCDRRELVIQHQLHFGCLILRVYVHQPADLQHQVQQVPRSVQGENIILPSSICLKEEWWENWDWAGHIWCFIFNWISFPSWSVCEMIHSVEWVRQLIPSSANNCTAYGGSIKLTLYTQSSYFLFAEQVQII